VACTNDKKIPIDGDHMEDQSKPFCFLFHVPSGKLTVCYCKWPWKEWIYPLRMGGFSIVVCKRLPEGNGYVYYVIPMLYQCFQIF
jgi:hypothetical protein